MQTQLRQALGTKARLERQMDGLDITDKYYDRKILDLQRRYDEQYGKIEEIEIQIDDIQSQIRSIRQEKISGDNIYQILLAFDEVYGDASEVERKEFMRDFMQDQPYGLRVLGKIVNVIADEKVLDEKGKIDVSKIHAFAFDQMRNGYYAIGEKVGQAWNSGAELMKVK